MAQAPYVPSAQQTRNKSVVERYFAEVLDRKRIELMPELLARDAVLHRPGFDVVGLDAAMQRLRTVLRDYIEFASELSGLIAEGDMVAVRVRHRVRAAQHVFRSRAGEIDVPSGRELEWAAIVQFRMHDGRIAEEWVMRDELAMVLQLARVRLDP